MGYLIIRVYPFHTNWYAGIVDIGFERFIQGFHKDVGFPIDINVVKDKPGVAGCDTGAAFDSAIFLQVVFPAVAYGSRHLTVYPAVMYPKAVQDLVGLLVSYEP